MIGRLRYLAVIIILSMLLSTSLSFAATTPATADTANTVEQKEKVVINKQASLGKVTIATSSTFELKRVTSLPQENESMVAMTFMVNNESSQSLDLIDYWIRVGTKSGGSFSVSMTAEDSAIKKIAPKSKQEINFFVKVGNAVKLNDLIIKVIKWDTTITSFERTLGTITLPKSYTGGTAFLTYEDVNLGGGKFSTFVKEASILKNSMQYFISANIIIENTGNKSITIPDYRFAIVAEGMVFTANSNIKDLFIQPKEIKQVKINGTIPVNVKLDKMNMVMYRYDETAKVERPIAGYQLPATISDNSVAQVNDKKEIEFKDSTIETTVKRASISTNEYNNMIGIYFSIKNVGSQPVALPDLSFSIITDEGITYPLTTSTTIKDVNINPLNAKEFQLRTTIPASISVENLKMVMNLPTTTENAAVKYSPIAFYDIPSNNQSSVSVGVNYEVSTKDGMYKMKLNSIQRLPFGDKDIMAANITMTNDSSKSLPFPKLTGYFTLDGIEVKGEGKTTTINESESISIKANSQQQITLLTDIPYESDITDIRLVVQEKDGENVNDILEFKNSGDLLSMPVAKLGETYNLNKSSNVYVRNSYLYEGTSTNLYYAEVEWKNTEKRPIKVPDLASYFRTDNGYIYPGQVNDVKTMVSPGGKVILGVWSRVAKNLTAGDLQLVLGNSVPGTVAGATAAIYNAVAMEIPVSAPAKAVLSDMEFYPNLLSISDLDTRIDESGTAIIMKFKYLLEAMEGTYENTLEGHELIIELVDSANNITVSQTLDIAKLTTGSNATQLTFSDPSILSKTNSLTTYTLNVYDKFEGHKRLISKSSQNYKSL